jgi:Na+-transporting NADH:ubiquinone oxidoreductase subunit NqrC
MASNMIWSHEIVHYLSMGHINLNRLFLGIILSLLTTILLLRSQFMVNDTQWLKRMISHHSTALTTSKIIKNRTKNKKLKKLADEIIVTQEREISLMKLMLQ